MTYLTNKAHFAINTLSKYIPSAFNFPNLKNEFLYYAKLFPETNFVLKSFDEAEIKIVDFYEVDYGMGPWKWVG